MENYYDLSTDQHKAGNCGGTPEPGSQKEFGFTECCGNDDHAKNIDLLDQIDLFDPANHVSFDDRVGHMTILTLLTLLILPT